MMGGEDFSYMLLARPGAFIFIGNGDTAGLHNLTYDFNDDAIPHRISYWVKLAETLLASERHSEPATHADVGSEGFQRERQKNTASRSFESIQ